MLHHLLQELQRQLQLVLHHLLQHQLQLLEVHQFLRQHLYLEQVEQLMDLEKHHEQSHVVIPVLVDQ